MSQEKYINPLTYKESLKYYRDIKNVVDTSREEGIQEGIEKGIEKGVQKRNTEVAQKMKKEGFSNEQIRSITRLSNNEIEAL